MKSFHAASDDASSMVAHIPGLRRYARALIGDSNEADDLVQECLTKTLSKLNLFRHARNERAYLYSVLHNLHVDRIAKRRRAPRAVPLELADVAAPAQPSQQGALEIRDLEAGLSRLPIEQREVVLLVGLKGMSYREVAKVTGVPVGTVMSRLSRGREALRAFMSTGTIAKLRRVK